MIMKMSRLIIACATAWTAAGCGGGTTAGDASTDGAVGGDGAMNGDAAIPNDAAVAGDGAGNADLTQMAAGNRYIGLADPNGEMVTMTLDHNANTFEVVGSPTAFTLTGTLAAKLSGFLKLTVTAGCDGVGCVPNGNGAVETPNGSTMHVVEGAGYFVVAVHDGGGKNGFGAVAVNNCDPGMFATYNFTNVGFPQNYDLYTNDAYGNVTLGGTAAAVTISGTNYAIDGSHAMPFTAPMVVPCNQGVTIPDVGSHVLTSANGVVIVDNSNSPGAVGLAQSQIALADIENHTYAGFAFDNSMNSTPTPVSVTFAGAPMGLAKRVTDIDNNILDPNKSLTINIANLANGLAAGTVTGDLTAPFKAAAMKNGAQTFLSVIIGASNGGGDGGMGAPTAVNLVLISH